MKMHGIRSRALDAVGYDADTHVLRIRFRHQGLYDYQGVPESVYRGLCASPHPWTEWGPHIKSTYPPSRLE
jgi:hypothetical protein